MCYISGKDSKNLDTHLNEYVWCRTQASVFLSTPLHLTPENHESLNQEVECETPEHWETLGLPGENQPDSYSSREPEPEER